MKNKVALITGGTRGIGLGIALSLAEAGYDLALNGQRDETSVEEILNEVKNYGVEVIYCQGNIANNDSRLAILQRIMEHYGQLNILINNAGVAPKERKDLLQVDEASFDWLMEINLKGPFFLSQAVAKWFKKQKAANNDFEGCIVNITSMSANVASINRGEYCISKAGLSMMSQLFTVRLSEFNIPVYEVRPGVIETDMTAGVKTKYDKMVSEGLTLEPRLGLPSDIGKAVRALVNGDIPYSTGQVITLDGGINVRRM